MCRVGYTVLCFGVFRVILLMLVYSNVGRHLVFLVVTILPCQVVTAVQKRFVSGSGICARYMVAVGVWIEVLSVTTSP